MIAPAAGDTDEVDAAGHFTKWANHRWGFTGVRVAGHTAASSGITLSACDHVVTGAGLALHGDADWWSTLDNDTHCLFGSPQETKDF